MAEATPSGEADDSLTATEVILSPETLDALTLIANNGHWSMPVAVVLSALFGALVTYLVNRYVIRKNAANLQKMQAHRATLDFIAAREMDSDLITAKLSFNEQRDSQKGFRDFLKDCPTRNLHEQVKLIVNDYELTALGIHTGILDEEFYKRWFRTAYVEDYNHLRPLISDIRTKHRSPAIYAEFEKLATSWGGRPIGEE